MHDHARDAEKFTPTGACLGKQPAATTYTTRTNGTTILSPTNYQEQIGSKTQTLMVYLQDFIGQYNSFLQGANTAISNANQVLTSIARAASKIAPEITEHFITQKAPPGRSLPH